MKNLFVLCAYISLLLSACQPASIPVTGLESQLAVKKQLPISITTSTPEIEPGATLPIQPSLSITPTVQPTGTDIPTQPGTIKVDTLDQEVYPFEENGKCSLAEAIIAANQQKQVDTCPPGGTDQSVIELTPGIYTLTKIDATPHQVDWAYSTAETGNALPAIVRTLTLKGNGAVLARQDATEPYRIFEVIFGTFTLENITIQGGEVKPKDWGGAIIVQNASLFMDGVTIKDSKAENGGGVYLSNGGLTVHNSVFSGNTATSSGGGLYAGQTKAEILKSHFIENLANGYGGGVYISETFVNIADSSFIGNHSDSRGGGINLEVANASILRSQFYRNYAKMSGAGVSGRNYLYEKDIAAAEADPMEKMTQSNTYIQMATQIPGFRETLIAQPSGMYVQRKLDIQVHDSCFMGNINKSSDPLNSSTAISGRTASENNYFGASSGPSGMGNGTGESIGREVAFEPFLASPPAFCDLSLAEK